MPFQLGSYSGSSTRSSFQVRLDSLRSNSGKINHISGDWFLGSKPIAERFVLWFRSKRVEISDDGERLSAELELFGKLPHVDKSEGRLECHHEAGRTNCVIRKFNPPGQETTVDNFPLEDHSPSFRKVNWIVDLVKGSIVTESDQTTLNKLLNESADRLRVAGVDVNKDTATFPIDASPSKLWNERDLRKLLNHPDVRSRVLTRSERDWRFYLLIATQFERSSTTGIMFDNDADDQFHRQGAAVFWNTIKATSGGNFDRDFRRTVVHEIGHIFNLRHSFESGKLTGAHAASTSFMNYPQNYSGGVDAYWTAHLANGGRFEFEEEYFIRHGHFEELIMGGAPFGSNGQDSTAFNAQPKPEKLNLELRIKPDCHGNAFEFGEPVIVEAKLENLSVDNQTVIDALEPTHRVTAYLLEQPGGRLQVIRPPTVRCGDRDSIVLQPMEALFEDVQVSYGIGTFYTMDPGRYRLQAAYYGEEFPLYSNILTFWICTPDRKLEKPIIETFDSAWSEFFSLWGSSEDLETDLLKSSMGTLRHPLQTHYLRCRQMRELSGYISDVRTDKDNKMKVTTKEPRLDRTYWRKLLALDKSLKLTETATPELSNLTYSTLATRFAAFLLEQGDKAGKQTVLNAISARHRKFNKKKPLGRNIRKKIQEKILYIANRNSSE